LSVMPDLGKRRTVHRGVFAVGAAPAASQQPQEMRLASAVGTQYGHSVAVPDLEVEWKGEVLQLEPLAYHRSFAGTAAGQAHPDVLVLRTLLRWPDLLELAQPGLRRLVTRRHAVVVHRFL